MSTEDAVPEGCDCQGVLHDACHSRDVEVGHMFHMEDVEVIVAERTAELKHELFAAQELSVMWHLQEIEAKRAGKQIKEELNKARDDIAGLLGNAEDIESLKLERGALREKGQALADAMDSYCDQIVPRCDCGACSDVQAALEAWTNASEPLR